MDNQNGTIYASVRLLLQDMPHERGQLLPALWRVVEHYREITPELIGAVSEGLSIPYAEVYGVASFYSLLDNPGGKMPIYVCTDVMCLLQGAEKLKHAAEEAAQDEPVAVRESACLGQCDYAPAAWSGKRVLRRTTAQELVTAVKEAAQ